MSVYNAEPYLAEAIESILTQSYSELEFIIIDDGSTDNSASILDKYELADSRIRAYKQENHGLAAALNRGIRLAKGVYLARQDADDISLPSRLCKQVEYLQRTPQVGAVGSFYISIEQNGYPRREHRLPSKVEEVRRQISARNPFCHGSMLMRRESLDEVGAYRELFAASQDHDLWFRMAEQYDLANVPEYLYKLRIHSDSISRRDKHRQQAFRTIHRQFAIERKTKGYDMLGLRYGAKWESKMSDSCRLRVRSYQAYVESFISFRCGRRLSGIFFWCLAVALFPTNSVAWHMARQRAANWALSQRSDNTEEDGARPVQK